jgi:hypothetical protein
MKLVKAKYTLYGTYGLKSAGEQFQVHDSVAEKLLEAGSVELVDEKAKDTLTEAQLNEQQTVAANKAIDTKKAEGKKEAKSK